MIFITRVMNITSTHWPYLQNLKRNKPLYPVLKV